MNRKKTIARIAAGFLSVVTFLSAVIGPVPAMAADSDANSVYIEDYPELKDVRDMLDEDEIVKAEDITVDADEDFEIGKDFKGIDYSSKKVKISLYDDDGFSSSKEGSYKPVYHADPKSGNHGYRFSRRITVVKKEEKKEAKAEAKQEKKDQKAEKKAEKKHDEPEYPAEIAIDDFFKCKIQVARVLACEKVEKSSKLLKFRLGLGKDGERTVVSGIQKWYEPETLVGTQVAVITNLKPAKLAGIESQGMILSALDDNDNLRLVTVGEGVEDGALIG